MSYQKSTSITPIERDLNYRFFFLLALPTGAGGLSALLGVGGDLDAAAAADLPAPLAGLRLPATDDEVTAVFGVVGVEIMREDEDAAPFLALLAPPLLRGGGVSTPAFPGNNERPFVGGGGGGGAELWWRRDLDLGSQLLQNLYNVTKFEIIRNFH